MITIRRSEERGHTRLGWLDSYHTFSFADYVDPAHVRYSSLRVLNQDRVAPGSGFDTHPHRNMEIVSYVLDGALKHKDNMGNSAVIPTGGVQHISAGTGVTHSEYNASDQDPVHFLQIWIMPNQTGLAPSYESKRFAEQEKTDRFRLLASPDGREGSLTIHQDAYIHLAKIGSGSRITQRLTARRRSYLHVARGRMEVNGRQLNAGDGAHIVDEGQLDATSCDSAEVLLFDLK